MKNRLLTKMLCAALVLLSFTVALTGCSDKKDGSRPVMNVDILHREDGSTYLLRDGAEQYCYQIAEGERGDFTVKVKTEQGSVDVVIYPEGDREHYIYSGETLPDSEFTVHSDIPGDYRVLFTLHNHVGEYSCDFSLNKTGAGNAGEAAE